MKKKNLLVGLSLLIGVCLVWYLLTPHSYEDCLLQGMKGIQSNVAANGVALACRQKYPKYPEDEYSKYDALLGIKTPKK